METHALAWCEGRFLQRKQSSLSQTVAKNSSALHLRAIKIQIKFFPLLYMCGKTQEAAESKEGRKERFFIVLSL
jgi:hypothetical protein